MDSGEQNESETRQRSKDDGGEGLKSRVRELSSLVNWSPGNQASYQGDQSVNHAGNIYVHSTDFCQSAYDIY
jgi:hypothetical protein